MVRKTSLMLFASSLLATGLVFAQAPAAPAVQANPTVGCSATAAELAANKKVALAFFTTTGAARVALADPSYKQHNPAFVKGARLAGMTDFDYFNARFGGAPAAGARAGGGAAPAAGAPAGGGGGGRGAAAGPQPPPGNSLEVVTAECDIVTVIHMNWRQDPTEAPGVFFQAYTFDSFRVRNGKLVEHWDAAVINAPAAPAAGAPAGGRGN